MNINFFLDAKILRRGFSIKNRCLFSFIHFDKRNLSTTITLAKIFLFLTVKKYSQRHCAENLG